MSDLPKYYFQDIPRMSWNKSSPRRRPPYLSLLASSSTNWLDLVHVPSTIPQ